MEKKNDHFGVDEVVATKYIKSLEKHIQYVREAGTKIGVTQEQLAGHDNSKWTEAEFPGYAKHFHGDGAPDVFSKCWLHWLHHIHFNPHHWQHWLFPDGYSPENSNIENGAVEMPQGYALEMIADWMGAEMTYRGSWDMSEWLSKNIPKIRVHSKTAQYLGSVLSGLGYSDIINVYDFAR